jgi:hypothetical protein
VLSDSFHRQNVQHLAGSSCRGELNACSFPSRLSKFDCSLFCLALEMPISFVAHSPYHGYLTVPLALHPKNEYCVINGLMNVRELCSCPNTMI